MLIAAAILLARFTVLAPREGMRAEFEAGYQRHLEWHRAHADPWVWHGWTVITGERLGTFIDATIDRTPAEIDAPVAPADDVADFARNVAPYAHTVSSSVYRSRPDLCKATAPITGPFASLAVVHEIPHGDGSCFELVSGGIAGTFLVIRPAQTFSEVVAMQAIGNVEALRYRKDLSYAP